MSALPPPLDHVPFTPASWRFLGEQKAVTSLACNPHDKIKLPSK